MSTSLPRLSSLLALSLGLAAGGWAAEVEVLVRPVALREVLGQPGHVPLHVGRDRAGYDAGHVPFARFLPLAAFTARPGEDPARPVPWAVSEALGQLGVTELDHLYVYDGEDGRLAAEAFYVLESFGFEGQVSVVDGQLAGWRAAGLPTTHRPPPVEPNPLLAPPEWLRQASLDQLRAASLGAVEGRPDAAPVVDAREAQAYRGHAPGAGVARPGHVPGARPFEAGRVVRSSGAPRLASVAALRHLAKIAGLAPGAEPIVYGADGGEAAAVYLALRRLGYRARLYDGGWLGYSRDTRNAVVRGLAPR